MVTLDVVDATSLCLCAERVQTIHHGITITICKPRPSEHPRNLAIDVLHEFHLTMLLLVVGLVDAEEVNSDDQALVIRLKRYHRVVRIFCHQNGQLFRQDHTRQA